MTWTARMLWAFLASLVLTVLVGVTAIVWDGLSISQPMLITSVLFTVYSLWALLGAVLAKRRRVTVLTIAAVGLGVLAGVGWIGLVWSDEFGLLRNSSEEMIVKWLGSQTTLGLYLMVIALVRWPEGRSKWVSGLRWVVYLSGCLAFVIFSMLIWDLLDEFGIRFEWMEKLLGSSLIVGTAGTLAVFVADRLTMARVMPPGDSSFGAHVRVGLDCPRCGDRVEVRANTNEACTGCRLKVRVELEEPRCVCGYLLHGLEAEVCPECGRAVEGGWESRDSAGVALGDGEAAAGAEGD